MHNEWFTFWLCAWGMGTAPRGLQSCRRSRRLSPRHWAKNTSEGQAALPPFLVVAVAWSLLVLVLSYVGAALLYVSLLFPAERRADCTSCLPTWHVVHKSHPKNLNLSERAKSQQPEIVAPALRFLLVIVTAMLGCSKSGESQVLPSFAPCDPSSDVRSRYRFSQL